MSWQSSGHFLPLTKQETLAGSCGVLQLAPPRTIGRPAARDPMPNSSLKSATRWRRQTKADSGWKSSSRGGFSTGKRAVELLDEANQLSAIFAQSRITATERLNAPGKSMTKVSAEIEKLKMEVANLKSLVNQKS